MMMKFLFFSSLAHLYFIMSSSVMPQCGDFEQKQYDDFGLVSAFRKYLSIPTDESYCSFRSYVKRYFKQSPIDCLNLLGRYRSNWVFKVLFWQALAGSYYLIDPTSITSAHYYNEFEWVSKKIRNIFLNCSCSDESKFKTELEAITLMVKSVEKSAFELKSLGFNEKIISRFDAKIAIWKYLIINISIDFSNKTIDYYSLSRTFNDVSILVKTDSSLDGPSLRLSKRYALFWLNLHYIYVNHCTVIFETHQRHKALIIYYVLKSRFLFPAKEFYPDVLRLQFERLYENKSQQLDQIWELLRMHYFESDRTLLGISEEISNYSELARFIFESSKGYCANATWKIRAFAELEAYLIRNGRKVDYSTK